MVLRLPASRGLIVAEQVKARHAIPRDQVITKDDIEVGREDIGRTPLRTLPGTHLVIGAKALRSIAGGERIVATMIAAPTATRARPRR